VKSAAASSSPGYHHAMKSGLLWIAAPLLGACSIGPPAHWAHGGAAVEVPRARWVHDRTIVDVMPDGHVLVDGDHQLTIDRGGRVFDLDNEPIALLEPDGRLMGPDHRALGVVGALHASPPNEAVAWLTVAPNGEVIRYDAEGDRFPDGVWTGCGDSSRTHQVCTLVTHLFALRARAQERGAGGPPLYFGPGVGVGIGVGVGFGH
jgi:hypothetical protein